LDGSVEWREGVFGEWGWGFLGVFGVWVGCGVVVLIQLNVWVF